MSGNDANAGEAVDEGITTTDSAEAVDQSEETAPDDEATDDPDVLRARVDALAEENDRLRHEYVRARRSQYRRTALAMALLGTASLAGAAAFAEQREVLVALGGTGLFGAVLTYFLTPERFVPATVSERIHAAHAANQAALTDELGLQDERVYVPTPEAADPARLFVPHHRDYALPESLETLLIVPDDDRARGVAFTPTGGRLYEEFEYSVTGEPATRAGPLAAQLGDAVVETFELAGSVGTDPDLEDHRLVVVVSDPVYQEVDGPDHPIVSVVGVGLAVGLDAPVTASVQSAQRADARIVYEWDDDRN